MADKKNDEIEVNGSIESIPSQDGETILNGSKALPASMKRSLRGNANSGNLPGPDRRDFLVKLSLFGAASAVGYVKPQVAVAAAGGELSPQAPAPLVISGTGTITSSCGASTYSFTGSVTYSIAGGVVTIDSFLATGQFVSGVDIGSMTLENDGNLAGTLDAVSAFEATGSMLYTDDFNTALRMSYSLNGTTSGGVVDSLGGAGDGQGLCTAGGSVDTVDTEIIAM